MFWRAGGAGEVGQHLVPLLAFPRHVAGGQCSVLPGHILAEEPVEPPHQRIHSPFPCSPEIVNRVGGRASCVDERGSRRCLDQHWMRS